MCDGVYCWHGLVREHKVQAYNNSLIGGGTDRWRI